MSPIERGLLWLPRRVAGWTSEHPLRAAGGVAALASLLVMALSVDVGGANGPATASGAPAAVAAFALAHPAYPVAALVGLAVLLFAR